MIKPLNEFLQEIDAGDWAVISSATDYPENWVIPEHSHEKHQLLYAIEGVMAGTRRRANGRCRPTVASGCLAGKSIRCAVWAR